MQNKKMARSLTSGLLVLCLLTFGTARAAARELVPLGIPTGVRMTAAGVVISAMNPVDSPAGAVCPGEQAGLQAGDILQTAAGVSLTSSDDLARIVRQSGGRPIKVTGLRGETQMEAAVQPVRSRAGGTYQIGLLVRDSMAGIGTLTYVDPGTGAFGALGHPVSDIDSGALLPLSDGSIVPAAVVGVVAGEAGTPGELIGTYEFSRELGRLETNTACGIFGTLSDRSLYDAADAVQTAGEAEIHVGQAEILTCVSGSRPVRYQITVEKVQPNASDGRSMEIRVTDPALLKQTGGIVPGMSGSPILQDGKLIGAVTHVLVNNPARGFAVSIDKMLEKIA